VRDDDAKRLLRDYPRIFFACHARHVRDPKTRRLLSAHQASILDHLDDTEAVSLMGLAKHMGVTPSTMSLAIEKLVRRGYVIRERSSGDRRRLELRLSPAGERIKEASSVLEPARVRALLAGMPASQRATALDGLGLLARAADQLVAEKGKRMIGLHPRRSTAGTPRRSRSDGGAL
jgi:DNA-binding MarR family transcriptional regulator